MNKLILFVIVFAFSFIINIQAQVAFPLKISDDRRYLVDQNNKPFPILGRTAWFIVSQTVSGYKTFNAFYFSPVIILSEIGIIKSLH